MIIERGPVAIKRRAIFIYSIKKLVKEMTKDEKYTAADEDSDLWPETRQAIRFLFWTLLFLLAGSTAISIVDLLETG